MTAGAAEAGDSGPATNMPTAKADVDTVMTPVRAARLKRENGNEAMIPP
jgi:hypothetical protein